MSTRPRTFPSQPPTQQAGGRGWLLIPLLFVCIWAIRQLASFLIDWRWWEEIGQIETFKTAFLYEFLPWKIVGLPMWAVFWAVHARALKNAGTSLREHALYRRASTLGLLVLAALLSMAVVDPWVIASYFGSRQLPAGAYTDPVFGHPLGFYLFDLPFYREVLSILLLTTFVSALIYTVAWGAWFAQMQYRNLREQGLGLQTRIDLPLEDLLRAVVLRRVVAIGLLILAARIFLGRYNLLTADHGFMVGIDYVNTYFSLPLIWVSVLACVLAAGLLLLGRVKLAAAALLLIFLQALVPPIANIFVRPSEITLQRPYIERHITASRTAFGLQGRITEAPYQARADAANVNVAANRDIFDNVRLWDWRAFHDTVTQIQALRPYYVFQDTDVDRYQIGGKMRQIMISPRELDIRQLPDASSRWLNPHIIYTHGYGLVAAPSHAITPDGLPTLLVQDAPPAVKTPELAIKRPEIYYGEVTHEPVFVNTQQPEFNYPSGDQNVHSKYEGKGGLHIGDTLTRIAAAINYGDRNILLTGYLQPQSRMLIRRNVRQRLQTMAPFLDWDADPYLVVRPDGTLAWILDAYTSSDVHPYSRRIRLPVIGAANYVRNSVKAVVDAYDGAATLYVADGTDPLIAAWRQVFPTLFQPLAQMPADLQPHLRHPELLFQAQAETYRLFHMTDPESFYNKEDVWELARAGSHGEDATSQPFQPAYVVATLPGETKPEFLLMLPFTPRNKDNLISLFVARCDPGHRGELLSLQLSKQSLIFGPLQISARINQDSNISKDLTLWNQQGSQVLMGQMLVLPVDNTFVYVQPIYIQASQARMPQLKRVALAVGNSLYYADSYEAALAQMAGGATQSTTPATPTMQTSSAPETGSTAPPVPSATPGAPPPAGSLASIADHMRRYRSLMREGRYAEAGRELEAIEAEATSNRGQR